MFLPVLVNTLHNAHSLNIAHDQPTQDPVQVLSLLIGGVAVHFLPMRVHTPACPESLTPALTPASPTRSSLIESTTFAPLFAPPPQARAGACLALYQ